MSLATKPVLNQFSFYENITVISGSDAAGIVKLDLTKSRTHLIHPTRHIQIHINKIYQNSDNILPMDKALTFEAFVIVELLDDLTGLQLSFDPNIIWDFMEFRYTPIIKNQMMAFHLITYDSGETWYGTFAGKYDLGFNQAVITRPVITSPERYTECPVSQFTINSSIFKSTYVDDIHESSSWKICLDELGKEIAVEDIHDTKNLVSKTYKDLELSNNSIYYVFVKYKGQKILRESVWSEPLPIRAINIEVDNPIAWRVNDYTETINDDGSYFAINNYTTAKTITTSTNIFDKRLSLLNIFDRGAENGYLSFDNSDGSITITGISGVLTSMNITYYGDAGTGDGKCIAKTVKLIADDSEFILNTTRPGTAKSTGYTFLNKNELLIKKKLKMIFSDPTSPNNYGDIIVLKISFTIL